MNLDQLNNVAQIPTVSYILWAGAVLALVAMIGLMILDALDNLYFALICLIAAFGLFMYGSGTYLEADSAGKNVAFQEALQNDFGVESEATLVDVRSAARESKNVVLRKGTKNLIVLPQINDSVLTFIKVADGEQLEKVGQ